MKISNKNILHIKAIAEIKLSAVLLTMYIDKNFNNIDSIVKNFLKNDLPSTFKIKSYPIYQDIVDIEWNKIQYTFIKSLKRLNKDNLLSRARLDSNLLINMPSQILLTMHKIYSNKTEFKDDREEEDYLIGLLLLFPSIKLVDVNKEIYNNKQIIKLKEKDVEAITVASTGNKKKFQEYKKKVEENKNSIEALKQIDKTYNTETLNLTKLSVNSKKIFFNDVWICSFLANSRQSHKNASGNKRNEAGYFIVGGERFRYCGDWSNASIGNVINCRCYLTNNY